jgi:hypothetical protein
MSPRFCKRGVVCDYENLEIICIFQTPHESGVIFTSGNLWYRLMWSTVRDRERDENFINNFFCESDLELTIAKSLIEAVDILF